ncbi:MAG: DUF2101 family protein [Candidatus Diapherotrites archaeon]|nr:DUF2101 family protein [Candidatus Diapherotrites archaeon]
MLVLLILLCALVAGGILSEIFGNQYLIFHMAVCIIAFFTTLLLLKREVGNDFSRYAIYFVLMLALIIYALFAVLSLKENLMDFRPVLLVIMSLIAVNLIFRSFFAKSFVEGKVLLCDGEFAAVEVPFDLFAAVNPGKYVVKCEKNFRKGDVVKVKIRKGFFIRIPEKVI